MKRNGILMMAAMCVLWSCATNTMEKNPLLGDFDTPFQTPPFDKIKVEHYKPAFEQALKEARAEFNAIVHSSEPATFANTIEALEFCGDKLDRISNIFFNLNSAETNDEMQKIALEISPLLTEFGNDITLNDTLFQRIKTIYDQRDSLPLNKEQRRLLERKYKSFVRNGADLSPANKEEYRRVTEELSNLGLQFGQNVLAATNAFTLHITDEADLAGLPGFVRDMGAEEAKQRELGGWVFTLDAPSMVPFMQYAENRALREKLWKTYNSRCFESEQNDNSDLVKRITALKLRMANLLGYPTYAGYALEERMAETPERVDSFLAELLEKSLPYGKKDVEAIRKYAGINGFNRELMPWDFSFYSEKYKKEQYDLDEEALKPYFKLEDVQKGIFMLADTLYGIDFKENTQIPLYHPDVKTYEVYDKDGRFLAVFYMDFFPRPGKKGGAWMTSFRDQSIRNGVEQRPFISVVTNFTKPTGETPSLLTFYEVTTLLHEFGHALHGIFAEGSYPSLTGTSVTRDFVELPSQIMENWAVEKEFLDMWAKHYQTGEKIPGELIDKIIAAKNYLSGYGSVRQLSFGINDMSWYTITRPVEGSVLAFERNATSKTQLLPTVDKAVTSTSFSHIFAGGYSAGYYSYKWAEVLEADAYSLFREKGVFNREVAESFRENILSKGNIEPAMDLYVKFRGHEPQVQALFDKLDMK